ncbi:MAG TPA: hypothetical protein VEX15_01820 [Nocardioidaceae bacterium]|nr:hypothetical protein [Nocardioidaceae bacterium]
MTPRRRRAGAVLAVAALAAALTAGCGDDGNDSDSTDGTDDSGGNGGSVSDGGGCIGETSGDVTLTAAGDMALPGGGNAGVGSVESDEDPPQLNLILGGGTEQEEEAATGLEVGDTFSVQGTSYTVEGFCDDKAYLAQSAG